MVEVAQHAGQSMHGTWVGRAVSGFSNRIRWITSKGPGTMFVALAGFIVFCSVLLVCLLVCVLSDATLAEFSMFFT